MMFIAIVTIACFAIAVSIVWRKWLKMETAVFFPDIRLDDQTDASIRSVSGCGTHIYVDMPGKRNKISIDCGIEIKAATGRSMLGDHIFITHTHADHIAALFCSILNARRPGATYNIYVPPSHGRIAKQMIAWMNAFETIGNGKIDVVEGENDWRFVFLKCNIILREAGGDMIVSKNNIVVKAVLSNHTIESCAYIIYTKAGGAAKVAAESQYITIDTLVYKPLVTFSGDTTVDLWKNNPHACQSKNVFAECTRYTGDPEDAHKNMHTHIADLESIDWSKCEKLRLYHVSDREKRYDIDAALDKHLPFALTIGHNTWS